MVNSLMHGAFVLRNLSDSDDTKLMRTLLQQAQHNTSSVYYCNNAGTVARFMIAYLALRSGVHIVTGDNSLCRRPIDDLVEALNSIGLNITYTEKEGCLPVQIVGGEANRKMVSVRASKSSQFASALMLMGLSMPAGISISLVGRIVSRPYIEMTAQVLKQAGVEVSISTNGHTYMIGKCPPSSAHQSVVTIENDWSAASYFYAISAILPDTRIRLRNLSLNSCQGDTIASELFKHFGVTTQQVHSPYRKGATSLRLLSNGKADKKLSYNFTDSPDLFPTVSVVCAIMGVDAYLRGIKNLRHKESDRIESICEELRRMGCRIEVGENIMHIFPSKLKPVDVINTHEDHRIAMAFAPLLLLHRNMKIDNESVVNKSFPSFWQQFKSILNQIDKNS